MLEKYAAEARPDEVVLMADTSMRRTGKTGFLVTPTMLHAHELGSTTKVPLAEIWKVDIAGNQLRVNSTATVANIFAGAADAVVELLQPWATTPARPHRRT